MTKGRQKDTSRQVAPCNQEGKAPPLNLKNKRPAGRASDAIKKVVSCRY